MVLDLCFREEIWVEEISLGVVVMWMVIKVISMIGYYHLVRMEPCEENWALGPQRTSLLNSRQRKMNWRR